MWYYGSCKIIKHKRLYDVECLVCGQILIPAVSSMDKALNLVDRHKQANPNCTKENAMGRRLL
jgi:hypothetical protein